MQEWIVDVAELQTLVTLAEMRSFSRAATALHLSQPAVSKRIAVLEAELDVRLVHRIGRRITLTDAGTALLPRARRVLEEIEDGRRALSRLSEHVGGRLSIGTSHHVGLHRLPDILRRYTSRYPDVDLDLRFMDSEDACAAVLRGELELGIVTLPPAPPPQLETREVWPDPLAVFVAPQHPLAHVGRLKAGDLAPHPAVLPGASTYTCRLILAELARHGIEPHIRLVTNYLETIKMLVSIGLGWSLLPVHMADATVHRLDIPELAVQRHLGVVWHARRTRSAAAQALMALMPAGR
ncbi:MAG: LysR family transcriptional regulator [Nevskiaceae bacterium]|nr:MAG: LysR family transcriptional regulator [Nevskiaceae bacterium]TBR73880.1 MAG: LysR family transcriptional regulator [Nevskiaceae bacterium]